MTTTSPALIRFPVTAVMASSSDSKTRAGPRWLRRSWPLILATHPSGARLPCRMTSPPVFFSGLSSGTMTSWPGVSTALSPSAAKVLPVTVMRDPRADISACNKRFASRRDASGAVHVSRDETP